MNNGKIIFGFFSLICIANLVATLIQWQSGIYLTKPFLMIFLSAWFYFNTKSNFTTFTKYIFFGIVFSIAGDTFLMFASRNPDFFLFGLSSFLVTHLLYILAFIKHPDFKNGMIIRKPWVAIPIFIYLISFSYYLWPDILDKLKAAVFIYSCIISTMLLTSINMKWRVAADISTYLIIGAALFVFSDSVIALNKFKTLPIPSIAMNFTIMVTYIIGQYMIASSCIKINKKI